MTLRVIVVDLETGATDERAIEAGEYVLTCAEPCHLSSAQSSRGGRTHTLIVSGRRPDPPRMAAVSAEEST